MVVSYPVRAVEVMRSARLAGIPEEQIVEMARLASMGRPKLSDFPASQRKQPPSNVLSESEDDEPGPQEQDPLQDGSPAPTGADVAITQAVTKLTEIAAHLTAQKKQEKSLDALLDGAGSGGSGETAGVPGHRKYAAALRALQRTLQTKPEEIYQLMERNMSEDFQLQAQLPGSAPAAVSSRGWLELRSKAQSFATPVRFLRAVAGIHDCLRANRVAEARARCVLLMAQGGQLSIDRGSWVVASELALEPAPPMASFAQHTLPTESEPPYTRLIDGRWFDLFLQKLQDYDSLSEKKLSCMQWFLHLVPRAWTTDCVVVAMHGRGLLGQGFMRAL